MSFAPHKNEPNPLNAKNIELVIARYHESIQELSDSFIDLTSSLVSAKKKLVDSSLVIDVMTQLKRDKTSNGPYATASYMEASNRIMSDLVVLYGVRYLLNTKGYSRYSDYYVNYGIGNYDFKNKKHKGEESYDIFSKAGTHCLRGEAFNVAPSYYRTKSRAMLKKLNADEESEPHIDKVILVNRDAFDPDPNFALPKEEDGVRFIVLNIKKEIGAQHNTS